MHLFLGSILPYVALAVFVLGMGWQTGRWLARPVPFALTLVGGHTGLGRQAAAVARELLSFAALYRGDRRLWLAAWLMHGSLALILVGHVVGIACLGRQFCWLGASPAASVGISRVAGTAAGLTLAVCLILLAWRRWAIPELRRLSGPADYGVLALLLCIACTGLLLRCVATQADLAAVRSYLGGLLTLQPGRQPDSALFVVHFALVNLLLLGFPFSKLAHLTGGIVVRMLLVRPVPIYPTPHSGGGVPR